MPASSGAAATAVAKRPAAAPAVLLPAPETFAPPRGPTLELSAELSGTDTIGKLLTRAGVAPADAAEAATLLSDAAMIADKGSIIGLVLGQGADGSFSRLERLTLQPGPTVKLQIGRTAAGEMKLVRDVLPVDASPRRFTGMVGTNLFWSLRAAGVSAEIARDYVQLVSSRLDVRRDLASGDRFDIVVDQLRVPDGSLRIGPLLYAGIDRASGSDLHLVRWTVEGSTGWFDPYKARQAVQGLERPVQGEITSRFGYRVHPILRIGRLHQGVDVRAAWGTPIVAPADGRVVQASWNGGHGRQVRLAHDGGISTSFSHLSQFAVAPGTLVRRGQVIGFVGSSGFSTGAHLHYELHRHGRPIDPESFAPTMASTLAPSELAALRARLAQLRSI